MPCACSVVPRQPTAFPQLVQRQHISLLFYTTLAPMWLLFLVLLITSSKGQFFASPSPTVFAEPGQGLDKSEEIKALNGRVVELEEAIAGVIMALSGMEYGYQGYYASIDNWTNYFLDKHQHLEVIRRYNKMKEEMRKKEEEESRVRDEEMRVRRYYQMRHACICSLYQERQLDMDCDDSTWTWLSDLGREKCCGSNGSVICNLDEGTPSEYHRWVIASIGTRV
jgi:hypothetical protein